MIRGIDHLVIACPDPDEAAATLESERRDRGHRRRPPSGGRHVEPDRLARGRELSRAHRHRRSGACVEVARRRRGAANARERRRARDLRVARRRDRTDRRGAPGCRGHDRLAGARKPNPRGWRGRRVVGRHPRSAARRRRRSVPHPARLRRSGVGTRRPWPSVPASSIRSDLRSASHGLDIAAADPASTGAVLHAELQLDFWALGELAVSEVGPHVLRVVPRGDLGAPGRREPGRRDRVAADRRCARPALRRRAGRGPRGDAEPTVVPAYIR